MKGDEDMVWLCLFCFILAILFMAFLIGLILNIVGTMLSMAWAIGLVIFVLVGAVGLFTEIIKDAQTYYRWMKEAEAEGNLEYAEECKGWVLKELKNLWFLPFASLAVVLYVALALCGCVFCSIEEFFGRMKLRLTK